MDFINLVENNGQVTKTDMVGFRRQIVGKEHQEDLWPEIRCLACNQKAYASGVVTPTPGFTPRFSHSYKNKNPEICPLSARSKRFRGFTKSTDIEVATKLKSEFYQFDNLRNAYLVCRELRGGQGKLNQTDFIRMVNVADSFGVWGYKDMNLWRLSLLLMLMANHPTPNGKSAFFYSFNKRKNHLIAHWVDTGDVIAPPPEGVTPAFLHNIDFQESTFSNLLQKQTLTFWQPEKLQPIFKLSQESSIAVISPEATDEK